MGKILVELDLLIEKDENKIWNENAEVTTDKAD